MIPWRPLLVVVGIVMLYVWMRLRGHSWQALARSALERPPHEPTSTERSGQSR